MVVNTNKAVPISLGETGPNLLDRTSQNFCASAKETAVPLPIRNNTR